MKKLLILSLVAVGLTACETMNRPPYSGDMGDYGFTYDLNGTPSPFVDTSYRPLTAYDLAAPILITITNQAPPTVIYQDVPEIGATKYSGESPRAAAIISPTPQINEAAGADRGAAGAGGQAQGGGAAGGGGYVPSGGGGYYAPGVAVVFPSGSITNTNNIPTNNIPTNGIPTNNIPTNNIPTNNFPTNNIPTNQFPTNRVPLPTNPVPTNAFNTERPNQLGRDGAPSGFTNNRAFQNPNPQPPAQGQAPAINEAAGTQNQPQAQPQGQGQGQGGTSQSVPFGAPPSGGGAPVQSPAPAPAAPATPATP